MKTHAASLPLLLSCAVTASAGESANYSITQQSQNTGGRSTSSSYTLDSSSATGGSASSPAFTQRGGFAGALFDPVALDINASPLTVSEGGTRQLVASLVLDDASRLSLLPADVTWSVVSGPLSFNVPGTVTAGSVFADTGAAVRGAWRTLGDNIDLTVLNVSADNYGPYASDGLDDAWQVQYFGPDNSSAGPLLDPDNDGWTNLFEYNAGLIPTDPLSVFSLSLEPVPDKPGQRRILFSPRLPGRTYTVTSSTTLLPESWKPLTDATVSDSGDVRTVTDPNTAGGRKYYRVDVQKP